MRPRLIASFLALPLLAATGLRLSSTPPDAVNSSQLQVTRVEGPNAAAPVLSRTAGELASTVVTVSQKDKTFAPATVTIRAGEAVSVINDDDVVHNVYCRAGDFKYNSGPQQPGIRSSITFATAGVYEVRCAIHPKMLLTVQVQE